SGTTASCSPAHAAAIAGCRPYGSASTHRSSVGAGPATGTPGSASPPVRTVSAPDRTRSPSVRSRWINPEAEEDPVRVTSLAVYPVKSTRGIPSASAVVEPWGLANDRRWAVVDEQGEKVTAREVNRLLTVTGTPTPDGGLVLTAPDADPLTVDAPTAGAPAY